MVKKIILDINKAGKIKEHANDIRKIVYYQIGLYLIFLIITLIIIS
jgi:hypothetical protein